MFPIILRVWGILGLPLLLLLQLQLRPLIMFYLHTSEHAAVDVFEDRGCGYSEPVRRAGPDLTTLIEQLF